MVLSNMQYAIWGMGGKSSRQQLLQQKLLHAPMAAGYGQQMSSTYLAEMREAKLQTTPLEVGKTALRSAPEHLVHRSGVDECLRTFLAQPLIRSGTTTRQYQQHKNTRTRAKSKRARTFRDGHGRFYRLNELSTRTF